MKKLLAILLAASMLFAFAACGDKENTEADETTAPVETMEDIFADEPVADETTAAPVADETETLANGETAAPVEGESETAAPAADMDKAAFVAFLNAETAKAAKGTYNFNRNCSYTKSVSLDKGESLIDGIISAIDEESSLDSVVGGFLGIGTKTGTYPKDELDSDYALKATTLTEADVQNFTAKGNGVYQFTLANAKDPKKTGKTPISRFTNDFITHEEVVDGIAGFTSAITVDSTKVNYDSIKVAVTVTDGKISSVKYSYNFDATLVLKAGLTITGTGAATTVGQYTGIKY